MAGPAQTLCPVHGCRSSKAAWHLACGRHWGMVPAETQQRLMTLQRKRPGSDEHQGLAQRILSRLNGEGGGFPPAMSERPLGSVLYAEKDFDIAGAWDEIQAELGRFKAAYRNRQGIEGPALEAVTAAFSKGFAQGYLHAKCRYDVAPAETEPAEEESHHG